MQTLFGAPRSERLERLATSLGRVRCPQPARIDRIRQSLQQYGQLSPVLVVRRQERLELLDGFKRRRAAELLGWTTLVVAETALDERAQWATMLLVNQRATAALAEVEEALILRELVATGLTQVEIAALLERHKSWVSRRIGLIERLHPELTEAIKLGLLAPGVARRLLGLPAGNQLRVAAAVQARGLGAQDTELLVRLWQQTASELERRELLADPRRALRAHYPETQEHDRPLSPAGRQVQRLLGRLRATGARLIELLSTAPPAEIEPLSRELRTTTPALQRLLARLGPESLQPHSGGGAAPSATA